MLVLLRRVAPSDRPFRSVLFARFFEPVRHAIRARLHRVADRPRKHRRERQRQDIKSYPHSPRRYEVRDFSAPQRREHGQPVINLHGDPEQGRGDDRHIVVRGEVTPDPKQKCSDRYEAHGFVKRALIVHDFIK